MGAVEEAGVVIQTLIMVGVAMDRNSSLQSSDRMCGRRHEEKEQQARRSRTSVIGEGAAGSRKSLSLSPVQRGAHGQGVPYPGICFKPAGNSCQRQQ